MTLEIRKIKQQDFNSLYDLLKQVDFPYLPANKKKAFLELSKKDNHLYAGFKENKLVLFLCFSERNSKLYFDIACSKEYQNKWANKNVLGFIFSKAFEDLGYQEFYVESFTEKARKAVERLGFEKIVGVFYKLKSKSDVVKKYLKIKG